jgi:hypothetical protein
MSTSVQGVSQAGPLAGGEQQQPLHQRFFSVQLLKYHQIASAKFGQIHIVCLFQNKIYKIYARSNFLLVSSFLPLSLKEECESYSNQSYSTQGKKLKCYAYVRKKIK